MSEFRYALRQLLKAPGFSLIAILTMALGIGASTVVFTVVNSVLLRPLTFPGSGQLAIAWERVQFLGPIGNRLGPNPRHVDLWAGRSTRFEGFSLVRQGSAGLSLGPDHPLLTTVLSAYPNLLKILAVNPTLGRGFSPEDGEEGHNSVAIITFQLWESLFHKSSSVIGQTVRLDGSPKQIIGVLPQGFRFPKRSILNSFASAKESADKPEPSVLVPLTIDLKQLGWQGDYGNFLTVSRLKSGVTLQEAQAELNAMEQEVERSIPASKRDFAPNALTATLQPLQEAIVGDSQRGIWMLMAAVGALMLIACVNLANAQLGRALGRQRESAVRSALGASRWNLLFHGLAESLIVSVVGGAAGVLLASNALEFIRNSASLNLPRASELAMEPAVLWFAVVLTAGATLAAGMLPALQSIRTDPQTALQQNSNRTGISRGAMRTRSWMIGAQVFGCTALLLITALFGRDLANLLTANRGFETDKVAIAEVDPTGHTSKESRGAFLRTALFNLRNLPSVTNAGIVSAMPLEGETWIDDMNPVGRAPTQAAPIANLRWISPGYFETVLQPLIAGRFLNESDGERESAVISATAARLGWPGQNPLGREFNNNGTNHTVVGVVADARINSLKTPPTSMIYEPFENGRFKVAYFLVRTSGEPGALLNAVRQAIWKADPNVSIVRVKTMDRQVDDSLAAERLQTFVLAAFALAALFLAMLGIYGVLSYSVASRRTEIGVRMALGANKQRIYRLTMGDTVVPVLAGFAGGWIFSILIGHYVSALLYGVKEVDITITIAIALLFGAAAAAASFLPAREAASIEPMEALRTE